MRIHIAGLTENVKNYIDASLAAGFQPEASLDMPEDFDSCGGLLLPGGADVCPERYGEENKGSVNTDPKLDEAQLRLLDTFYKAGKPILAICRGHQLLNVYFGGTLIQDLGEKNAVHRYENGDKVHLSSAEKGSWLCELFGESFFTNSAHHQAVDRVAPGFKVILTSSDGVVEAIEKSGEKILSVQFHPERMCCAHSRNDTVDGLLIFKRFYTLCSEK